MSAARSRRANDKHNHLQRTPILVMGCSLLIACCIAFGGTNWTASAQPSEDQLPEQNAIVEPGYYQETIGSYEAISQSDDDERAENLRLAAEAINGYVIEPGATFSFNEVVGDTTAERGYKEAPKKDMGRVMGALTQRTGGNFDKAAAAATLNQRLS